MNDRISYTAFYEWVDAKADDDPPDWVEELPHEKRQPLSSEVLYEVTGEAFWLELAELEEGGAE